MKVIAVADWAPGCWGMETLSAPVEGELIFFSTLCQQTFNLTFVLQEMKVEELSAVRQTLQADLETSIRRIVDLQAALEEVESSDESDTER